MKIIHRSFLLIALLVTSALGQESARTHDIVYDDYFTQAFIQGCAVSPDGKSTVYVQWVWDKQKDGRSRDLWIVNNSSKAMQRLTFDPGSDENPQWSPDGKYIYFTGHCKRAGEEKPPYDGKAQVWRINPDGSNLMPVTNVKGGIDDYEISKSGNSLYYTVSKDNITGEWKDLKEEYQDDLEFGYGINQITQVWKLDLNSWRSEKIIDDKRYITDFAVSPDEKRVAMITTPDELNMSAEGWSQVDIFEVKSGQITTLYDDLWRKQAPSPYGWLENLAWSDNSNLLGFTVDFDGYPQEIFCSDFSGEVKIQKLKRPEGVSAAGGLKWYPGKEVLCFLGDWKARERVYSIDVNTNASQMLTPGDVVVEFYDFCGKDGSLAAVQSELTYYLDLVLYAPKKKPERITNVNPQFDTWKIPQISIVKWVGADGDTVEGILELPPDYKGGEKLPFIVNLHGGPTASVKYSFLFWIYGEMAFSAKGYAVLAPNYRGSTGYGDDFMTDLVGRENEVEVKDIMAGVDYMIAQGIADPERMAVMGWSNGGYLTNCLIASNRFKAASSGAGIIDMAMQWGEEDTPGHVINFQKGLPWETPDKYREASPLWTLKPGITTAVLIHSGGSDTRVPTSHSRALFRALHNYIKAPCELVIYPDEGHGLSTYTNRQAKMKWDHAWFEKYIGK